MKLKEQVNHEYPDQKVRGGRRKTRPMPMLRLTDEEFTAEKARILGT
jgi:hypothetical protein